MRILITGFIVFVIWCFISAWLYNDVLLPAVKKPVPVQMIPDPQKIVADSLAKIYESMPKKLMIYFEFDKANFKNDLQTDKSITEFKEWLEKFPGSMVYVTGHTDFVGAPDYNKALAMKRAIVIEKYLEAQGIVSGELITKSEGETQPAADYLTSEGRAKNRRTEISIKMK